MIKPICLISCFCTMDQFRVEKFTASARCALKGSISFLKDMGEGKQHRWINKSFLNALFNHPISFSVLIVPLL